MEVLRLKLEKKSCENPFLVSFFILEVEGDSGIPVTPGIHPKTQVKRRARLFEAWKNDNRKATPLKIINKESFCNIISITPPHFFVLLSYVCSH